MSLGVSTMTGAAAGDGSFAMTVALNANATNVISIQSLDQVGNVST